MNKSCSKTINKNWLVVLIAAVMVAVILSGCFFESGKSAYEIALDNGFVGSEAQWLASLKGADAVSPDIYDIYYAYLEKNDLDEGSYGFGEFIGEYLDSTDLGGAEYVANWAMRSVVGVVAGTSAGSGVIYQINQQEAYIITNYHVVYSTEKQAVQTKVELFSYGRRQDKYTMTASFVGGSMANDIALLRADLNLSANSFFREGYLRAADIDESNEAAVGASVTAVGNAAGRGIAATYGVVSVDSEDIEMSSIDGKKGTNGNVLTNTTRVIRIDAAVNQGNSGGGLFDSTGRLLGIVNAKSTTTQTQLSDGVLVENIGYAIPFNVAVGIAENIRIGMNTGEFVEKCALGIKVTVDNITVNYDGSRNTTSIVEAIKVQSLTAGGLGSVGGLKIDDLLVSAEIGGTTYNITRLFHLTDLLYKVRFNDTFTLTVIRGTEEKTLSFNASKSSYFVSV